MNLKILSEFGEPDNKALLINLPQALLSELHINDNAEVDIASLLKMLEKAYVQEEQPLTFAEHVNLINLIFNEDRAVDERNLKPKK